MVGYGRAVMWDNITTTDTSANRLLPCGSHGSRGSLTTARHSASPCRADEPTFVGSGRRLVDDYIQWRGRRRKQGEGLPTTLPTTPIARDQRVFWLSSSTGGTLNSSSNVPRRTLSVIRGSTVSKI